eukprot:COSAG06_NODE_2735_length_6368_cov_19.977987_5_plen_110_part_00
MQNDMAAALIQDAGAQNAFPLSLFRPKTIILPRQARDKHRESSTRKERLRAFFAGDLSMLPGLEFLDTKGVMEGEDGFELESEIRCTKRHFAPFIYKNDHFAKTGSGQT